MPTTYTKADQSEEVHAQLRDVMKRWHGQLESAGVTVDILWAANDDGPPLKKNGYPAAALIKKTSLKERANGARDALLIIDSAYYERLPEPEQLALLDHELEHLAPVEDNSDNATRPWKYDDLNRPKLKTLPHDYEAVGFYAVMKRHGQHAGEYRQLESIRRVFVQQELPFPETEGVPA